MTDFYNTFIGPDGVMPQATPYEQEPSLGTETQDKTEEGVQAVVGANEPKVDTLQLINAEASYSAAVKQQQDRLISRAKAPNADMVSIKNEADETAGTIQSINESDDILTPWRKKAVSLTNGHTTKRGDIDKIAVRMYTNHILAKSFDESSMDFDFNTFANIADLFIPDTRNNIGNVGEILGVEGDVADVYVNSVGYIGRIRQSIQSLPPVLQAEAIQLLSSEVAKETGNEIKTAAILRNILESTPEELTFEFDYTPAVGGLVTPLANKVTEAAGALFKGIGNKLISIFKSNAPAKIAAESGNVQAAAKAADTAIREPAMRGPLAMDDVEAAAAGDPMTDSLEELLKSTPQNVSDRVHKEWKVIDELVEEVDEVKPEFLPLTPAEKEAAVRRDISRRVDSDDVGDVQWTESAEGSATVTFKVDGKEETFTHQFTVDDITGGFQEDSVTTIGEIGRRFAASPNFVQGKDRDVLVEKGVTAFGQASRTMKLLGEAQEKAVKAADDIKKVNHILDKGNREGRVYSYTEATKEGIGGVVLSEADYIAYLNTRRLFDHTWSMENKILRDELTAKGRKIMELDGERSVVKEFDTPESATSTYRASSFKQIALDGKHVAKDLDDIDLPAYYSAGYRMVQVDDHLKVAGNKVNWALVKKETITVPKGKVLNYEPGYVPVIRQNANYFVREAFEEVIDGVKRSGGFKSIRYFDNAADAEKFVAQRYAQGAEPGSLNIKFDGDMDVAERTDEFRKTFGGLYKSRRAANPPKFGLEGTEGARVAPLEALQGYLQTISNRMPINTYRLGLEKKWRNHAERTVGLPKGLDWEDSLDWVVRKSGAKPGVKGKLISAHEQVDHLARVPIQGERIMNNMARYLGDSLSNTKGGKDLAKYAYNLRQTDPAGSIRAATHNMLLGMGNPAQIIVQASALVTAVSIHPIAAMRGLPKYFAFTIIDWAPKKLRAELIRDMSRIPGMELRDLKESYTAWERSGLRQAALYNNADYSAVVGGRSYGLTAVGSLWGKTKSGLNFPYRAGETIAKRMAFTTAWHALEKRASVAGTRFGDEVTAYSDQLTLSMSSANKAAFQKGWTSVPTQFVQVFTKFIEASLGKEGSVFTKGQKTRMMLGQASLFGAAGIPLGDFLLENFVPESISTELSAEQKTILSRGMLAYVVNDMWDIDALVSGRMALGADSFDTFYKALTEQHSFVDGLLGPTGVIADRVGQVFKTIGEIGRVHEHGEDIPEDVHLSNLQMLGKRIASIPTSGKNLFDGMDLYTRHILGQSTVYRDKRGGVLWDDPESPPLRDAAARVLGFTSQTVSDVYDFIITESQQGRVINTAIGDITHHLIEFVNTGATEPEQAKRYSAYISSVVNSFQNPQERKRVLDGVYRQLSSKDRSPEMAEALSSIESELTQAAHNFNPLIQEIVDKSQSKMEQLQ